MTNIELLKEFIFRMSLKLSPDEKVEAIDSFTGALDMQQLDINAMNDLVYSTEKLTKNYINQTLKHYGRSII